MYYRENLVADDKKENVICCETTAINIVSDIKTVESASHTKVLDLSHGIEKESKNADVTEMSMKKKVLSTINTSIPKAAPRRVYLMKDPPPPPPKPIEVRNLQQQNINQAQSLSAHEPHDFLKRSCSIYDTRKTKISANIIDTGKDNNNEKHVSVSSNDYFLNKCYANEYNLAQKSGSSDTNNLEERQSLDFYENASNITTTKATIPLSSKSKDSTNNSNNNGNYSLLLCNGKSTTTSSLATRKREKLLHRFSDAATLSRKLRRKKENSRTCRSMTEMIEMLADPVTEDDFLVSNAINNFHYISMVIFFSNLKYIIYMLYKNAII